MKKAETVVKVTNDSQDRESTYIQILTDLYPSITTRCVVFYRLRKQVGLDDVSAPKEWMTLKNAVENEKLKNRDVITINQDDITTIINPTYADFGDLQDLVKLLYQTGRRFSEVLEGDFKVDNEKLLYIPLKNPSRDYQEIKYLIDTTPELVMERLNVLRGLLQGRNTNSINQLLNRRLKQLNKNITPHTLRSFYVETLKTRNNINKGVAPAFTGEILNHKGESSTSRYNFTTIETPVTKPIDPHLTPSLDKPDSLYCSKCMVTMVKKSVSKHLKSARHNK